MCCFYLSACLTDRVSLTDADVAMLARQAVDLLAPDIGIDIAPGEPDGPTDPPSTREWQVYPRIDDTGRFGIWLTNGMTHVGALGLLIDGLSNDASETSRFWGKPFPVCPGHRHPTSVEYPWDGQQPADAVIFRCPATHEVIAQIRPAIAD